LRRRASFGRNGDGAVVLAPHLRVGAARAGRLDRRRLGDARAGEPRARAARKCDRGGARARPIPGGSGRLHRLPHGPDERPLCRGRPLDSPFGTIHGTNITFGIGRYTADEFYHTLTKGEARDGRQIYPAMPYVSYRSMTREDSDAIYAYLMNQRPAAIPNPKNSLRLPYNIRSGLALWNVLFARDGSAPASTMADQTGQRGRYLVETLGHCGMCHSPRGALGQIDRDRPLTGNAELGRLAAPEITPAGLAARGWDPAALRAYLRTGVAAPAAASGEMLTVVLASTRHLSDTDLEGMTTYLLGDPRPAVQEVAVADAAHDETARRHYLGLCAGCHGPDGEGVPHVAVALRGNSSVRDPDPHNLIVAILDGLPEHDFAGLERMQEMPSFARELGDADIAALASWLRARYGGQPSPIGTELVARLRADAT
jgi:mono/diheme cytochrome c family protein